MKVLYFIILLLLSGCAAVFPCKQLQTDFSYVFGNDNDVISENHGGEVDDFLAAAKEVKKSEKKVKIGVPCNSSCAVFADMARPNVCIFTGVVFGFHMATRTTRFVGMRGAYTFNGTTVVEKIPPPASRDIARWVHEHGGYPSKGLLLMGFEQAKKFWPVCK